MMVAPKSRETMISEALSAYGDVRRSACACTLGIVGNDHLRMWEVDDRHASAGTSEMASDRGAGQRHPTRSRR